MEDFIREKKSVLKVIKAKEFASNAHGAQLYGNDLYSKHLEMVYNIVSSYGYNDNTKVLAFLHDVVEDTETTVEQIADTFDNYIGECVSLLTDCDGKNRKERKQKTNKKLSKTSNEDVLIVRAADRLANIISCIVNENIGLFKMYQKEHKEFKKAVYRPGVCDKLWTLLDSAAEYKITLKWSSKND